MNDHLTDFIVDRVIEEGTLHISGRNVTRDDAEYLTSIVKFFLQILDSLELVVLPRNMKADAGRIRELEELLHRLNSKADDLTPQDFNVHSVLSYLASMGWLIIPPR